MAEVVQADGPLGRLRRGGASDWHGPAYLA